MVAKKGGTKNAVASVQFENLKLGFGITLNLGNYESLRIEVGVEVRVPEGTDVEDVRKASMEELKKLIAKQQADCYAVATKILKDN